MVVCRVSFVLIVMVVILESPFSSSVETCTLQGKSRLSDYCHTKSFASHLSSISNSHNAPVHSDDAYKKEESKTKEPSDGNCYSGTSCSRPDQRIHADKAASVLVDTVADTSYSSNDPEQKVSDESNLPIAVWWYPFTYRSHVIKQCSFGKCLFTHDREKLQNPNTGAVLFYGSDIEWDDLPLPRRSDIYWALLHDESPKNEWAFNHDNTITLFNITSTFSRYSDVPLTTRFIKGLNWLRNPAVSLMEKKGDQRSAIAYVQSSCHSPSDRERYVKELMKYIQVDSLGSCFHNKDLPNDLAGTGKLDRPEFWQLMAKYKFTLAFENANCPDYTTEKLWRTLHLGSIPIYLGTDTAREWIPSNKSVIFTRDFSSPKELADYVTYLDNNDEEYLKYLQFKMEGGITNKKLIDELNHRAYSFYQSGNDFIQAFECYVCDRMYQNFEAIRSGKGVLSQVANGSHYGCPRPFASLENVVSRTEDFQLSYYQMAYEKADFVGEAVQNMIAAGETDSSRFTEYFKQVQNL